MTKKEAEFYIDIAAGEARARYVSQGVGQESTYMLKAEQAKAFKANNYTGEVPTFVAAEMAAMGSTAQEAADFIIYMQDQWMIVGAYIEQVRRTAKVQISTLTDGNDISAACESALQTLKSI